jgi:hypothetical protein
MIQRINISLDQDVIDMGKEVEALLKKTSFSALISDLIVEEWQVRFGDLNLSNQPRTRYQIRPASAALNDGTSSAPAAPASPADVAAATSADIVGSSSLHSSKPAPRSRPAPRKAR